MLRTFSFKAACQRYKSLEMDEKVSILEQKFPNVEFQDFQQTTTPGAAQYLWASQYSQVGTKGQDWSLPGTPPLPCCISSPGPKQNNWERVPSVPFGLRRHLLHSGACEEGHSPRKLGKYGRRALIVLYPIKNHSCKIGAS